MDKDTTYVALDDSKRKIVAGILRPRDAEPELREIVNDPRQIRRLLERLNMPVTVVEHSGPMWQTASIDLSVGLKLRPGSAPR